MADTYKRFNTIGELEAALVHLKSDIKIVNKSDHISMIKKLVSDMIDERRKANVIEDPYKKALAYESKVKPYLQEIRTHIDKLELVVDNELWPLPKYRELLFTR